MREFTLAEQAQFCGVLDPAADAAGRTGRWVSCARAHKMYFLVYINQGNAATVQISVQQAKNSAGGNAKVITNNVRIWAALDIATSDVLVRAADAVNYTTDAGVKAKQILIEVDPVTLDQAGGFDFVTVITGASNVANITSAMAIATPPRFEGDQAPSLQS